MDDQKIDDPVPEAPVPDPIPDVALIDAGRYMGKAARVLSLAPDHPKADIYRRRLAAAVRAMDGTGS